MIPISPVEGTEQIPHQATPTPPRRGNADPFSNESNDSTSVTAEPKGDPDMAPVYLRRLLPVFCHTFQSSMIPSVRKASLTIIKKMVHYSQPALLAQESSTFISALVEVVAAVLDNEEDEDGHLVCMQIINDLMHKAAETFLDHFARLGIFSKVQMLASSAGQEEQEEESDATSAQSGAVDVGDGGSGTIDQETQSADSGQPNLLDELSRTKELVAGRPYHWREWCIARGRDCLYIWSDAAALELSNGSNGWFRFILDGKLATMYSSGSPEGGSDSSENRGEFLDKLQRVRTQIKPGTPSQALFPSTKEPSSGVAQQQRLTVGNWSLTSIKDGELIIQNSDGQQQATILREDLPGFVFESNRGTKHTFTAETALGPELAAGWAPLGGGCGPSGAGGKRGGRVGLGSGRFRSQVNFLHILPIKICLTDACSLFHVIQAEATKQKVRAQAQEIYQRYFQVAQAQPRGVVARLAAIVGKSLNLFEHRLLTNCISSTTPFFPPVNIERGCAAQENNRNETSSSSYHHREQCVWRDLLRSALNDFRSLLEEDSTLSAFELQSSGLVQALHRLLSPAGLDDYLQVKQGTLAFIFCLCLIIVYFFVSTGHPKGKPFASPTCRHIQRVFPVGSSSAARERASYLPGSQARGCSRVDREAARLPIRRSRRLS